MTIRKIESQAPEIKKLRVAAYCRVSTDSSGTYKFGYPPFGYTRDDKGSL